MKSVLKRLVLRLPIVGPIAMKRDVWRMRLHALLRGPSPASPERIRPILVAGDRAGYLEGAERARVPDLRRRDRETLQAQAPGVFALRRFCLCCNEHTSMRVDPGHGFTGEDGHYTPNWREELLCSRCRMNNRQRLVAKLVQQAAADGGHRTIYLMEQVTPIFEWVRHLPGIRVHGSEYLGHSVSGGTKVHGVRHEDVMNLSYPDDAFDLIVSNDVMEHIPDPARALRECFRVLRPGGSLLATFPFHVGQDRTVARARLVGNDVEHLLPPQYHGNPVSANGSLVFHDFGWDLLESVREVGFSPAHCELYSSDEHGHLGTGLLVFRVGKPAPPPVA